MTGVSAYFGFGFTMDGTHLYLGFKIGSAKLLFPIVILNIHNHREDAVSTEKWEDIVELGCCYFVISAIIGYFNNRK